MLGLGRHAPGDKARRNGGSGMGGSLRGTLVVLELGEFDRAAGQVGDQFQFAAERVDDAAEGASGVRNDE